ncbi:hypothetical protein [Microbacterium sp. 4NA327F11]|uniref:hypothetical protein n=1 Tax=Microbacterium sp. 4NA327F11 TaxID=2502229 RepID=UPI0010F72521|nr:hypothetical protein [Microbacterium sp. 4NA327F11]
MAVLAGAVPGAGYVSGWSGDGRVRGGFPAAASGVTSQEACTSDHDAHTLPACCHLNVHRLQHRAPTRTNRQTDPATSNQPHPHTATITCRPAAPHQHHAHTTPTPPPANRSHRTPPPQRQHQTPKAAAPHNANTLHAHRTQASPRQGASSSLRAAATAGPGSRALALGESAVPRSMGSAGERATDMVNGQGWAEGFEGVMSLTTRIAVASFDDMRHGVRVDAPDAAFVLVSWSRVEQSCAVMGLLDDDGAELPVRRDLLARLTSLLARPVSTDTLRLAYPDAPLSQPVLLRVPVDEPEWARVAGNVFEYLQNGLRVSSDDVRDALWVTLAASEIPAGSVRAGRITFVPELPGDNLFVPTAFFELSGGRGPMVSWEQVQPQLPNDLVVRAVSTFVSSLAESAQLEASLRGSRTVLTDVVVNI